MMKSMEQHVSAYEPPQYDSERLKQFYYKTAYGKVLPKSYRPKGRVNRAAFADAMIGVYVESLEIIRDDDPMAYATGMARAAFTLDFLAGTSPEALQPAIDELKSKGEVIDDPREYAIGIVGRVAEYLKDSGLMESEEQPTELTHEPIEVREETAPQETNELHQYADVAQLIRGLHEQHRLRDGEAQTLLLLLRQARSPLGVERQVKLVDGVLPYIKGRLRRTTAMQPHKGDRLEDVRFSRGAEYMETILKSPTAMLTDDRVLIAFAQTELIRDDTLTAKDACKNVLGHIGYVIDKMYQAE
jgi:hypothetical protein